ncbi:hypothetical protein Noc_1065 [Nitrosococcus oceani ATCC 19707]|uniref:Uncharacterized protein n=2 Tax=Nitrosococcus oceani TaxID=1229 RepID=Q3JC73_NITOC|nr:hypothetical protein [Nitrosococcus oceani]ABA57573.1 hypothetical protein Noc_1065 [Nitrosococcus oceani ATCC 19707]EDZ67286.1 hypothetical protein NOC27_613 [Nitrosococcus oceani AFC27]KFI20073.1 hypothetical protein IB75_05470 [Nitrosococcus oceani C-27]GEM20638.1 hypothetical protein NONS58_20570 [Nitrosococcus oceani]
MNKRLVRIFTSFALIFFFIPTIAYAEILIQSGHSGEWFNPERSGEGFFLEVLENDRMVFSCFTDDSNQNQMWLFGAGNIVNDKAVIPVFVTEGGVFGSNFDPNEVVMTEWGTVEFSFSSCHKGQAVYNSMLGFGSGAVDFTHLTMLKKSQCAENPSSLEGTYTLERLSIQFSDQSVFDSENPNIAVTGAMYISENNISQEVTIFISGEDPLIANLSGTFVDEGSVLVVTQPPNVDGALILIERDKIG